ncbi:hypothetical protein RYX36_006650, partial [Vicia faba]
ILTFRSDSIPSFLRRSSNRSLLHYMLPRKRASEGVVNLEEQINNSNNAGSAKKARIGSTAVCSRESTVIE